VSAVTTSTIVDEKYYQAVPRESLAERLVIRARDRIFGDFMRMCAPHEDDAVIDVGVSDVVNDAANVVERKYPRPERITAVGLGDLSAFRAAFPGVTARRIEANRPLPFADRSFAVATSNAVLEHVGSRAAQIAFVRELARVARKVFITVPNRFFPVEHHTAIPLMHFWDRTFVGACAAFGKQEWSRSENLILMSKHSLAALAPADTHRTIGHTGIRLGPFSSNLFLFIEQRG
jgi:hypothetical protein